MPCRKSVLILIFLCPSQLRAKELARHKQQPMLWPVLQACRLRHARVSRPPPTRGWRTTLVHRVPRLSQRPASPLAQANAPLARCANCPVALPRVSHLLFCLVSHLLFVSAVAAKESTHRDFACQQRSVADFAFSLRNVFFLCTPRTSKVVRPFFSLVGSASVHLIVDKSTH